MVVGNRPKTVNGFALGDLVEIRSAEEILAGLDSRGEHDSLQFMPEMLQYCGRTFRIDKIVARPAHGQLVRHADKNTVTRPTYVATGRPGGARRAASSTGRRLAQG